MRDAAVGDFHGENHVNFGMAPRICEQVHRRSAPQQEKVIAIGTT